MRRLILAFLLAILVATLAGPSQPAAADQWRYRGYDIHRFRGYDYNAWRHGYWYHGWHGGRYAWWWYGGGLWYPYPAPIYPYPNPYVPPTVVVQALPPAASGPPPPQNWYYCANPQGYYPYVPECSVPWQSVPATP